MRGTVSICTRLLFASYVCLAVLSPRLAYSTPGVTDWLNIHDYGDTVQSAINHLPSSGGVVYVPAGSFPQYSQITFPSGMSVRLVGDGRGISRLTFPAVSDTFIVVLGGDDVIEGLTIDGSGNNYASAVGVALVGLTGARIAQNSIRDCDFIHIPKWHISATYCEKSQIERCTFDGNQSTGAIHLGPECYSWALRDLVGGNLYGSFIDLNTAHVIRIDGCSLGTNADDSQPAVKITTCNTVSIDACDFESSNNQYFVQMVGSCSGVTIANSNFSRFGQTTLNLVKCYGAGNVVHGLLILNPNAYLANSDQDPSSAYDIYVGDTTSTMSVVGGNICDESTCGTRLPAIVDFSKRSFLANINDRVRLPRVPTYDRDGSQFENKKVGDMIYNSLTNKVQVWTGSVWADL